MKGGSLFIHDAVVYLLGNIAKLNQRNHKWWRLYLISNQKAKFQISKGKIWEV